jgi:hypothetical protein
VELDPDRRALEGNAWRVVVELVLLAPKDTRLGFEFPPKSLDHRQEPLPGSRGASFFDETLVTPIDVIELFSLSFDFAREEQPFGEEVGIPEDLEAEPLVTGELFGEGKGQRTAFAGEVAENSGCHGFLDAGLDDLLVAHAPMVHGALKMVPTEVEKKGPLRGPLALVHQDAISQRTEGPWAA